MKQLHETQISILKNLLFAESLTYTKLKEGLDIENNTFSFHVHVLLDAGFIEKKVLPTFLH